MVEQTDTGWRIRRTEIDSYCSALPATIVAQGLGGIYLVWALWPVIDPKILSIGLIALTGVLTLGYFLYRSQQGRNLAPSNLIALGRVVIGYSFTNGCFWGLAAVFLYPPPDVAYAALVFVLLSILPFVPVAAMAGFLPAFFAYLIPVSVPFWFALALPFDRPGLSAALLFSMLIVAAIRFALQYNANLVETSRLRFTVEQQRDSLEQANREKSTFMAAASHDLRQPVHSLTLTTDALRFHSSTAELRNIQGRMQASVDAMHQLLDAMLDISKLDAGVIEVDRRNFFIGAVMQSLAAELIPQASAKGLRLSVVPTTLIVNTDPVLLQLILRNFISNAIRFTHKGGIVLGCRRRGGDCLIQVVDTGIGIEPVDTDRIFGEFTQLGNPERDRRQGLGLGLANVKRMATLLAHPILVSSRPRCGTIFSLRVPCAVAADVSDRTQEIENKTTIEDTVLLLIDDETDIRAAMYDMATRWSCKMITAGDVSEAIGLLAAENVVPDVVIADYRLRGGATGIDAIADVRRFVQKDVPALIITGDTGKSVLLEVRAAKHPILYKPARPGQIKALVRQILSRRDEARPELLSASQ